MKWKVKKASSFTVTVPTVSLTPFASNRWSTGLFDPVRIESLKGQREGGSIPLKSKKEDMTMWIGYRTRAKEATHKTRLRGLLSTWLHIDAIEIELNGFGIYSTDPTSWVVLEFEQNAWFSRETFWRLSKTPGFLARRFGDWAKRLVFSWDVLEIEQNAWFSREWGWFWVRDVGRWRCKLQ